MFNIINHTSSNMTIRVNSTLDQGAGDESFGINNLYVWIYNPPPEWSMHYKWVAEIDPASDWTAAYLHQPEFDLLRTVLLDPVVCATVYSFCVTISTVVMTVVPMG